MKKTAVSLALILSAAACTAEAPKKQEPAAKPAAPTAAKPTEAPAKPTEAPAAPAPGGPAAPAAMKLVKTTPSADYPLKTCVVSGEELASMGERSAYKWGDTEVQFCCPDCVKEFEKEPEKYLAMVRAATK